MNSDRRPGTAGSRPLAMALAGAVLVLAGCVSSAPLLTSSPGDRTPALPPPPPPGGYDLDRPYPLLPGDMVRISVQDDPDLNIDIPLPPDGWIEVWKSEKDGQPRKRIKAQGMSLTELQGAIADVYEQTRFRSRPYVQVTVVSLAQRVVYVRGQVNSADGIVTLPSTGGRLTLSRAIQAAGGPTEEADLSRVSISRKDPSSGTEVSLPEYDLVAMETLGLFDRDPPLEPNDIVRIPALGKVWITGNITKSDEYLCVRGMTLTMLITKAGGLKAFSKLSDIRVMRGLGTKDYRAYRVDYGEVLDGNVPDPLLQPGDRVNVEEDWK